MAVRDPDADFLRTCFAPYAPRFYASGTAALAAAVRAAITRTGGAQREVVLPAYACPNLVSAVWHAGGRPRLADLEPNRPWMHAAALEHAITPATVAVIAVDLFGLPERYDELIALARNRGLVVIQDSAQGFPRRGERVWQGDLVVVSFGRGKPVSLLGGGAVLCGDDAWAALLPSATAGGSAAPRGARFWAQMQLYNALRRPALYWLPSALPLLHLGETRFAPLVSIDDGPRERLRHLQANVEAYWDRKDTPQETIASVAALLDSDAVLDLPAACSGDTPPRLLRYPLLIKDAGLRDALHAALHQAGLGASTLYGAALPAIEGLEALGERAYPHAEAFARQLLTLPVHSGVRPEHIERMYLQFRRFGLVR
jgi:dTDP-4-amino-4,6-dideoxygalactose transaminase